MLTLKTQRLDLMPLKASQLQEFVTNPEDLEAALGFKVSRDIISERLLRAIRMKLSKMQAVDALVHAWYTYWLVIIRGIPFGAGLVGFKGSPDGYGEVEIGYGIDPKYQGMGYTTEAVRALITWAFSDSKCCSVVAPGTLKANLASLHVLSKVGMSVYEQSETTLSYRITRQDWLNQGF